MFSLSPAEFLATGSIALTVIATGVALYAAFKIKMRDNVDTFFEDVERVGRWNKWVASLNGIAAALLIASQAFVILARSN